MNYQNFQFDNQLNKNINSFISYFGFAFNYQNTHVNPKVDPEINDNVLLLKHYYFKNFDVGIHYIYNTMNTTFYLKKGILFKTVLTRSLYNDIDLEYSDEPLTKIVGSTNSFTKLSLEFEKRIPFNKKITGIFAANTSLIF